MDAHQLHEQLVARLFALCNANGGAAAVADKARVNAEYLRQVLRQKPTKSGEPRGLGLRVIKRLDAAYPGWMNSQHSSEGRQKSRGGVALILSEPPRQYLPLAWEETMTGAMLPAEFVVELPDDSMAPKAFKGDCVLFSTREIPRAGDGVLVRDREGQTYFRLYKVRRPGAWTAEPASAAYHSLDSESDGLTVLAVSVGIPRQRWG